MKLDSNLTIKVLYIAADPEEVDLTRQNLAQSASYFQLDSVPTGSQALARLEQKIPYDLVLINLPLAIEQVQLWAYLREHNLSLAGVIMAEPDDEVLAQQVFQAAAAAYLIIKHPGYLYQLPLILEIAFHRLELTREVEGIARDVTERKQAEEALQDSLQKLKIAYDQTIIYARELNVKINELKQAEETLRQNANDLAVLYEASQVFLGQSNVEATLELACRLIVERFEVQMSWVGLITRDDFDITPMASYSSDHQRYVPALHTTWNKNLSGQAPMGQAIQTAQAVATNRLQADTVGASWQQAALADGYHSMAALPLLYNQEVLGVVNVYSVEPDHFTHDRLQLLQSFANLTAVALTKARLFEQVRAAHERLQLLSQQLVDAQEAERRHIARELHDEIGQTLTAVKINLQAVQRLSNAAELVLLLQESMDIVEQAIQQVRNLSLDLRPSLLDDLGLIATLRWYLDRQAKWAGFTAHLTVHPANMQLPANLETVCFRVVQEALTNILRHAQAQHVRVDLQGSEKSLQLLISDDGLGFEVETILKQVTYGTGLGLVGMQERVSLMGGQFEINAAPGQGTQIRVSLPLPLTSPGSE